MDWSAEPGADARSLSAEPTRHPTPRRDRVNPTPTTAPTKPRTLAEKIDAWPWTKTFTAIGVIGFALTLIGAGILVLLAFAIPELRPDKDDLELVEKVRDYYNDTLQWTALAATGGIIGLVGKRLSTKPEVVQAEAKAAADVIVAKAKAEATLAGASGAPTAAALPASTGLGVTVTPPELGGALGGDWERDDEDEPGLSAESRASFAAAGRHASAAEVMATRPFIGDPPPGPD